MFNFFPPTNLFFILADLLQILALLILVEVIVSWAINFNKVSPYRPWVRTLRKITWPFLEPFRKIAPPYKMGGLDISPMLAIVVISLVVQVLVSAGIGSPQSAIR